MLLQSQSQWRNQRGNQKIHQDKWKWKENFPKFMRCRKSSSKRDVYSDTGLPQETRKLSNKNLNYQLKELEKEEQSPESVENRK